jgi:TetR/AcrR family transcriptional regulator, cholesterol catabolism regulator
MDRAAPRPASAPTRASGPRDPTRRARILEAAERQFSEHGFKGTRLEAVAEDAGCAKGALYLEFEDKTALLREVVAAALARAGERFAREVATLESPRARLREGLRLTYVMMGEAPMFARLLREDPELRALRPGAGEQGAREDEERKARAQVEMFRGWVDEGIARGEIRPDLDRDAIPFVLATLRFAPQHLALVDGYFPRGRVLDAIVDIFDAGLAPRARAAERLEPSRKKPRKTKKPSTPKAR